MQQFLVLLIGTALIFAFLPTLIVVMGSLANLGSGAILIGMIFTIAGFFWVMMNLPNLFR